MVTSSEVAYAGVSAAINGPYFISKMAVEAYASVLRQELSVLPAALRTSLTVLTPGAVATPLLAQQQPVFFPTL